VRVEKKPFSKARPLLKTTPVVYLPFLTLKVKMAKKKQFGELEDSILSIFISHDRPYSVKEIQQTLKTDNAYTTIMTVMSRLFEKGILTRIKEGRSFLYQLKKNKPLIHKLKKKFHFTRPSELFSFFLEETDGVSDEEIKKIESMIKAYRRKQK